MTRVPLERKIKKKLETYYGFQEQRCRDTACATYQHCYVVYMELHTIFVTYISYWIKIFPSSDNLKS